MALVGHWRTKYAGLISAVLVALSMGNAAMAQSPAARIDEALQNVTSLTRPERIGYATVWDGNKYVQCRRLPDRSLRCEAAGTAMQPTLGRVLTSDRLGKLKTLGWQLDPNFGNYVRIFPATTPTDRAAANILQVLSEAYSANVAELEFRTAWIKDVPCPPRNGPSQNLAGMINDAPAMQKRAVTSCSYTPAPAPERVASAVELIALYGPDVAAEIQRLRVNIKQKVFVVFNAAIGYVQCTTDPSTPALYCEAQSADSWPALTSILTPERVSLLIRAGYAEPGRAPNYSKSYALNKFTDLAIAAEILTLLHAVYGYSGATKLKIIAEQR